MSELVIIEKELSYLIMQAAFEVYNELGPGFPESIYEEAMNRELTRRGIVLERQKEKPNFRRASRLRATCRQRLNKKIRVIRPFAKFALKKES